MKSYWKAVIVSAALCSLFVVVYGACNYLTSLRPNVGSFYFAWERRFPLIPAMIIPYMTIDLFFIAAPFFARSDRERRTLAWRIAGAILIAAAFFLLFPLKFAFERPHLDGPLGEIFNHFRTIDLPFNQFPSLHIALGAILVEHYYRHSRGVVRGLIVLWFILIGISPLVTYQHHVIDIFGGLALGIVCFYFFRETPLRQPFTPNPRIACYYAAASLVIMALAFTFTPWTWLLLWPAFSLALIALAYLYLGPGIYRKTYGRIPASARILLWPILLGQHLSLLYYARQCRPYDRLTDHLLIGRRLSSSEARDVPATAVLDLTAEFSESPPFRNLPYLQLPILDLTAPTPAQIQQALAFIKKHSAIGTVYLHCKIGYSRTAVIAAAHLLATAQADSVDDTIATLRRVRPSIVIRPEALRAIQRFAAQQPTETLPQLPA